MYFMIYMYDLFSVSEDFLVSSCYLCSSWTVLDFCGLLQFIPVLYNLAVRD